MMFLRLSITALLLLLVSVQARAVDVPQSFTLDGQLFSDTTNTTPLQDATVLMRVQVLDEDRTCILYEETQTVNTVFSKGYFSVQIGSATGDTKRGANDSNNSMSSIFQNLNNVSGKKLSDLTPCTVLATGGKRRFVRVAITPSTMAGGARTLSPDLTIDSVPNAIVAERAESLQGLRSTDVLKVNVAAGSALSQANLESVFTSTTRFNALSSLLDGTSTNYVKASGSGAQMPVLTGAPMAPTQGSMWFDTSDQKLKYRTGTGVTEIVSTSTAAGSVTSVGLTAPSELSVTGAPVTSTGTIALSWGNQTTNKVFAAPDGSTGAPTFRSLTANDIPSLAWSKITSGTPTTLAGYGITDAVKNAGTVPSLQSGLDAGKGAPDSLKIGRLYVATDTAKIYRDSGTTWDQIGGGAPTGSAGGDLSGTYPNPSVAKIQGVAVSASTPMTGQVMKLVSSTWTPSNFSIGDLLTSTGAQQFSGSACTAKQTLTWSSLTDTFTCTNIAGLDASAITTGTISAARLPASATSQWATSGSNISYSSGNVGIGTTNPAYNLDVRSDAMTVAVAIGYGASNYGNFITGAARGSQLSPAASQSGDVLGLFGSAGYGATGFPTETRAYFQVKAAENWTDSAQGTSINIGTTPIGSNNPTDRITIASSGNVGVGVTAPSSKLDVNGAITAQGMGTAPGVSSAGTGRIYYDTSANKFKVSQNGGAYADLLSAGGSSQWTTSTGGIYYNTGKVGIGNTNPATDLHITGAGGLGSTIEKVVSPGGSFHFELANTGTGGQSWYVGSSDSSLSVGAGKFWISGSTTSSASAFVIDSANNVGVGAINPQAKFHVNGGTNSNLLVYSSPAFTTGVKLSSVNDANNANQEMEFAATKYYFGVGNVGIGTAAPSYKLHIADSTAVDTIVSVFGPTAQQQALNLGSGATDRWSMVHNSANTLVFWSDHTGDAGPTAGARMVITDAGNVGIGTTGPSTKLHVAGTTTLEGGGVGWMFTPTAGGLNFGYYATSLSMNNEGIKVYNAYGPGAIPFSVSGLTGQSGDLAQFKSATGTVLTSVAANGDVNIASGALRFGGTSVCTSAGCTSSSDLRLKENIAPLSNSLEKVVQLQGVEYDYRDKEKYGEHHQVGVIAQEVEKIYPEVVVTDGKTGLKAVAYDHLVAPLIEAVKTLHAKLVNTDARVKKLEIENAQMKADSAVKDQKIKDLEARLEKIESALGPP